MAGERGVALKSPSTNPVVLTDYMTVTCRSENEIIKRTLFKDAPDGYIKRRASSFIQRWSCDP